MIKRALSLFPIAFTLATSAVAQERVWIDIEEDVALAASYWPSAAARAGVLMLHGCMADRSALAPLAEAFAAAGYSALTYDMFSHGESRTPRLAMNTREGHDAILSRVSADLTRAHHALRTAMDAADASAPGEPRLHPVWHDRSDARFEFIRPPRAALLAGGESAFFAHRLCLNGTGGCRDHPYRLAPDGAVTPLRRAYAATLHERLPEGWGTWKGIWLEPAGPRAEASVYLPGDANASPSFHATASLRLRGDTLALDSMSLVPERDRFQWALDPGEDRVGYVRAGTSERELSERYGAQAVRPADIYLGEGFCTPGTVLFPDTPWRAEVAWADSARTRPAFVRVDGTDGPWRTPLGVGLGTTVARLAELAGEPVTFGGFGWDYGGGLHWEEGGGRLVLGLMPDSASYRRLRELAASGDPRAEALFGERTVRSDRPLVGELRVVVVMMRMDWSFPAIERGCE